MTQTDNINTTGFAQTLQTLWSIESQLVEAMPRLIAKASNLGLQKNLALHFEETRQHKVAVEGIAKQLDIDPTAGEPDSGLQSILQEGEQKMMTAGGSDLNALIIEGCINVEHYEISRYQTAAKEAEALGKKGVAARLNLTLEEERQADTKLNFLHKVLVEKTAVAGAPGLALK